ncbi:MAG: SAM-dependent methyltransferase [Kiritimatiellaeota bacterium]|nr:SAM-dependent methyltransferase [Kiritimatiellota bacterium]
MPEPDSSRPELVAEIRAESACAGGRITFARFMELALYHPQFGYYTGGEARIGKRGDFFTSVSVGPLFGKILANFFLKLRAESGSADFAVWEFGGRDGVLRTDVLAVAPELTWRIIEAGEPLPAEMTGCVFSNELLDALPVHRVQVRDGMWQEVFVTATSGGFGEQLGPLSDLRLAAALAELPVAQMEGYRTEINLRAQDWLKQVAARLRCGWVLTFDYGFKRGDYFAPHRREGHLQCYFQHTRHGDPFRNIGKQDITAHVDFSAVMDGGRALGLETLWFCEQGKFLLDEGADLIREIVERDAGKHSPERNAIHQLIHPVHMGRSFKALLQRKPG